LFREDKILTRIDLSEMKLKGKRNVRHGCMLCVSETKVHHLRVQR
jgi:hypothetical protein